MKTLRLITAFLFLSVTGCSSRPGRGDLSAQPAGIDHTTPSEAPFDTTVRTIHLFVALCDNQYQGIVPVPARIGNGQDPDNNLYWGCGFGARTHFKASKEWQLVRAQRAEGIIRERLIFRHATQNCYLVADAYDGRYIRQCTRDFLSSGCGRLKDTLQLSGAAIGIAGNARLIAYIGHDGLMDFQLAEEFANTDHRQRDVIVLACYSKKYFAPHLSLANVRPLVWTTGLMCPEAYTLHDALTGYLNRETAESIRTRAALAYRKYQKCSERAARGLLVTGW